MLTDLTFDAITMKERKKRLGGNKSGNKRVIIRAQMNGIKPLAPDPHYLHQQESHSNQMSKDHYQ